MWLIEDTRLANFDKKLRLGFWLYLGLEYLLEAKTLFVLVISKKKFIIRRQNPSIQDVYFESKA